VFVRDRFPVLISQGGPEGTWCGSGRSRRAMAWHPPVAPHWDPGLPACIGGGSAATMWEDVTMMVMATPMALRWRRQERSMLDEWSWKSSFSLSVSVEALGEGANPL
jgi:hypothetical protein